MSDTRNELLERWLESPGLSGNPREAPNASWSKLGEAFIAELTRSWEAYGKKAIADVADKKPEIYLKLVASFASKDMKPESGTFDDVSDAELRDLVMAARAALKAQAAHGGGGGAQG